MRSSIHRRRCAGRHSNRDESALGAACINAEVAGAPTDDPMVLIFVSEIIGAGSSRRCGVEQTLFTPSTKKALISTGNGRSHWHAIGGAGPPSRQRR
jgi:hypothetical protein